MPKIKTQRYLYTAILIGAMVSIFPQAPTKADDTAPETQATTEANPSSPEGSGLNPQDWWIQAQTELFDGIELNESQQEGVALLLVEAETDRNRFSEAESDLKLARREGNSPRINELSALVIEYRDSLRPEARIDKMRLLLSEDQVDQFDKNRRMRGDRQLAERLARRKGNPQRRGSADAAPGAGGGSNNSP